MPQMHPITLRFRDKALELAFAAANQKRTRHQGQMAMAVGMFVYLLASVLDRWLVPPELSMAVWITRLTALCVPTVVMLVSFTPAFDRMSHTWLASVGMAAGIGLVCMQMLMPIESSAYCYPMMVLVTFYTYNFVGTRFIYALGVDLFLLALYNSLFFAVTHYPVHMLVSHDFFIVSANLIGGSAGYINEWQRRILFLRERELDIERQYHQERSLHDPLTRLPNRDLLYDRIEQSMTAARRDGGVHCGFFLDLDGFKSVNDRLGHEMGDKVLRQIGQRLVGAVRAADTVARIGGDEFFVLAHDIGSEEVAVALAKKLLNELAKPLPGVPGDLEMGVSMGLCLFPYPGMTVSGMIHRADEAMYRVKSGSKGDFAVAGPEGLLPD